MIKKFSDERVLVPGVRIEGVGEVREIGRCWISILTHDNLVGIWLNVGDEHPFLTVPLRDAVIRWPELQVPMP